MEEFLTVDTDDGHLIYGTLNSYDKKKDKLIIFVHGLSGNQHEHQYFNAVPFFCSRGYDVFRFDFYGRGNKCRQSSESSISTHARDVNSVLKKFKDKYSELFLVGHSIGCLAIMNADLGDVKKTVYWDPTCGFDSVKDKNAEYNEEMDGYILHWGWESIVSEEMIKEWKEAYDVEKYSKRLKGSCSFVFAGSAGKFDAWEPYIGKRRFVVVEGASHRFIEEGTLNVLFEETLKLLES